MYFNHCTTAEELKTEYRKLAMKFHPDNGGDEEKFKAMQSEFSKMFDRLKNIHKSKDGDTYEKTGEYATQETAQEFMEIINYLLQFSDLEVELCGSWIWIGGNTQEHKDELKKLGCKWSKNKKMWYWQHDGKRHYHKGTWSIDRIRYTYGSTRFKADEKERLTATA